METTKPSLSAVVFCGPSGAGKSTLIGRLLKNYPNRLGYSVSHTTRAPREGEVNGREYFFVDREQMLQLERDGKFLEMCTVHGNMYGTTIDAVKQVREQGKICVVDIDVKGAKKLREGSALKDMFYIFVTAPSLDVLRDRIQKRGADSEEVLQRRLNTAVEEFRFLEGNAGFFTHVITNDDLEQAYKEVLEVLEKELERCGMEKLQKY
ncbi:Guanylate kinase 50S ribosome binding GTPase putative AAA domain [Trypanosoma vivax]|uniref:guanylate kinase n=1 Tax=Trypanosoma vivax (strain Y486) TaxID=1055687 RepID=G0U883_TRYVY|nr:putative guanylate kinase [Trypanosoma vivax]KAH8607045.1 Guanylate kinase 50S ribosome binding GTPase putative AAA domain [Trypanosoma vivax]CCC52093.1 putative guanylate kinase [Trypanosoma vivax Y486]